MSMSMFHRALLTTTALTFVAVAAPVSAQQNDQQNRSTSQNQSMPQNQANRTNGQDNQQQMQGNQQQMQGYSDQRNFSKISVAAASDLVGQTLGSSDGSQSGDVEYVLIEPVSGKVMYLLVGMGGMLTADQQLAIVPFEEVKFSKQSEDELQMTLSSNFDKLKQAPTLSDAQLTDLTSPRMQVAVMNYWSSPSADEQQGSVDRSGNQSMRQNNQNETGQNQNNRTAGNQGNQQQAQQQGNQQQGNQQQAQQRQGQQRQGQQRQGMSANQNQRSAQNQTGQTTSDAQGNVYTLVARTYISTLAPPAVMRPDQLRGASVVDTMGEDLGEIDKLIVDLDRGYVAYALMEEGAFLGMGGNFRPVPIQALRWQEGETFVLPIERDQLSRMPSLINNDLPANVRRRHVERLYQSYDAQPYWQQARMGANDGMNAGRSGSQSGRDAQSGMNRNNNKGSTGTSDN